MNTVGGRGSCRAVWNGRKTRLSGSFALPGPSFLRTLFSRRPARGHTTTVPGTHESLTRGPSFWPLRSESPLQGVFCPRQWARQGSRPPEGGTPNGEAPAIAPCATRPRASRREELLVPTLPRGDAPSVAPAATSFAIRHSTFVIGEASRPGGSRQDPSRVEGTFMPLIPQSHRPRHPPPWTGCPRRRTLHLDSPIQSWPRSRKCSQDMGISPRLPTLAPFSAHFASKANNDGLLWVRGRDGPFGPPPARIRTRGITSYGSYLGS
jgi:hypothetical protein